MAVFAVRGQVKVATPQRADRFIEPVLVKLVWRLHHEHVNDVKRSERQITYKRGCPPLRYDRSPLAIFDPGTISVDAAEQELSVRYDLSLTPLYCPTAIACLLLLILWYEIHWQPVFFAVLAFGLAIICGGNIIRTSQFRTWLKEAVVSAISEV
jgi:hypothetical protein